jgi:serine/threonine-protein kinase
VLDGAVTRIKNELGGQPKVEADLLSVVGRSYNGLGLFPQARSTIESAIALRRRAKDEGRGLAEDEMYLADVLSRDLDIAASDSLAWAAVRTAHRAVPPDDPFLAKVLTHTAAHIGNAGRETEADSLVREAIGIYRRHGASEAVELSQALAMLADRRYFAQDWVAAETLGAEALRLAREHEGPNHPDVGQFTWALGLAIGEQGKPGGERLVREGLAILQHSLGPDHPDLLPSIWGLAHLLLKQKNLMPAESLYRELTIRGARISPSGVLQTVWGFDGLAQIALLRGDTARAEVMLDSALAVAPRLPPRNRWAYAPVLLERGQLRAARRDYPGAEAMLLEALDALHRQWGDRDARTRQSLQALVGLYAAWGKPERARFYQDRLGPPGGAAPRASSDSARGKGESRPS